MTNTPRCWNGSSNVWIQQCMLMSKRQATNVRNHDGPDLLLQLLEFKRGKIMAIKVFLLSIDLNSVPFNWLYIDCEFCHGFFAWKKNQIYHEAALKEICKKEPPKSDFFSWKKSDLNQLGTTRPTCESATSFYGLLELPQNVPFKTSLELPKKTNRFTSEKNKPFNERNRVSSSFAINFQVRQCC